MLVKDHLCVGKGYFILIKINYFYLFLLKLIIFIKINFFYAIFFETIKCNYY